MSRRTGRGSSWIVVLFGVLSLTVLRMLPVQLSLIGTGIRAPTIAFLGWFGPRGLASILFVLLIAEETEIAHRHRRLPVEIALAARQYIGRVLCLALQPHTITCSQYGSYDRLVPSRAYGT